MSKRLHAVALASLAVAALSTAAEAGPCVPGTGSTATANTCIGAGALSSNTTGSRNTANGYLALSTNTTGQSNTAGGSYTLRSNTTGQGNTANGDGALFYNTTGNFNTASGLAALSNNTTGYENAAIGTSALQDNTTGFYNTASGAAALYKNTTGVGNTASGYSSLINNTTGSSNTASGRNALFANTVGSNNTASGFNALQFTTTGSNNTALGFEAGVNVTTGSNNIVIGNRATAADSNTIRIGTQGTQTRIFVAGIRGATITGGQAVVVNASGQLGVVSSSRRYKQDIQPMGDASGPLMQLHPVTFRYKQAEADGSRPLQFGLIAEEVEQVMPGLVVYNADGTPESVAYHLLPSLLLNEYQKQARDLVTAKAELARAKDQLEAMDAEIAALKLAVSHLAAAPSDRKMAANAP